MRSRPPSLPRTPARRRARRRDQRRRDVDDRTAPAPAHRLEHRLDSEHDAVEVDLEGAAPMLRRSVRVARRAEPACVVDEDVDAAERLLAEGDEGTPTVAVGGVGTEHPGAAAVTLDLPN